MSVADPIIFSAAYHDLVRPGWSRIARPEQRPPINDWWTYWLILAGRGWGKTRTGVEWVRFLVENKIAGRLAIVAKDPGEARDVIVEGESGILATASPICAPKYESSKKKITWSNGAKALIFSSEDPDELRGPQHEAALVDELGKYRNHSETWDNLLFGMRLGKHPRICITTTPRPTTTIKSIVSDSLTVVVRGKTYDNLPNLSPIYKSIIKRYEGTRLGRQELDGEILDDVPGALWTYGMIDAQRISSEQFKRVEVRRIAIGVDPNASEESGTEAGIVVAARDNDGRGYVLTDRTIAGRPEVWAKRVAQAAAEFDADVIVAEVNNGGDMVESTLRAYAPTIRVKQVRASRGKIARAEPIALRYERGEIAHVGTHAELEDEMCTYQEFNTSNKCPSPNRMDALVWAFTELFETGVAAFDEAHCVVGDELLSARAFPHFGVLDVEPT